MSVGSGIGCCCASPRCSGWPWCLSGCLKWVITMWPWAALLLALIPVPIVLPRLVGAEHWMQTQSWFDVVAVVCLIGFVPDAWSAGLLIAAVSPAASAATVGRRTYVRLAAFGAVGSALVAWTTGVPGWVVPSAVAVIMIPLVASYCDVVLSEKEEALNHLDEVASSSSAVFWEIDGMTGEFLSLSGQVVEVLGRAAHELPTDLPSTLIEEDRGLLWAHVLDGEADRFVLKCRSRHADGHLVWLRLDVRRMTLGGRHILRGTTFDITELVHAHEEMRRRAEVDHLTGLANRSVLVHELEQLVSAGRPVALFVLDLDRFKEINDTLGHAAGDEFLVNMAERFRREGVGRLVARMGGDEFAVILDVRGGLDMVRATAEQITRICEQPLRIGELDYAGSASVGIAVAPIHASTAEDLLRRADLAMYAAKRAGTRYHVFELGSDEASINRLRLSAEIDHAMADGQFRLWFQPKIDFETGRVVGAEGLVRWHHPERGVLSPGEFLDLVELSRHRAALTIEVLRQGVAFLAELGSVDDELHIAVNISVRDLLDPTFASTVTSFMAKRHVTPKTLVLEVTEADLMEDRSTFVDAALALRATGVELSIDDFGTGHSSLLRLHQLPVDELKIDRSFVRGLGKDRQAEIIVKSIIELGRALGHRVVAEGIERQVEITMLRDFGCFVGQGYLFSAAVPPEQFVEFVRSANGRGSAAQRSTLPAAGPS